MSGLSTQQRIDIAKREVRVIGGLPQVVERMESFQERLTAVMRRGYVAAYRILSNADDAREAVQEAATRALAARDRYDARQPFYPWFYRILKNHCLDRLSQGRRLATVPSSHESFGMPEGHSAESDSLIAERIEAVSTAIVGLPPELRELIELRHFQDLSYEEMAEVLHCPVGTVMSRLYRARKQLREKLIEDPRFSTREEPRRRGP